MTNHIAINKSYPGVVRKASAVLYRRYYLAYSRKVMDIEDIVSANYLLYLEEKKEQGNIPDNWLFRKIVNKNKNSFKKEARDSMFYKNERLLLEAHRRGLDIFDIVNKSTETVDGECFDEEVYQRASELCEICIGCELKPETVKDFVAYLEEHCDDYPEGTKDELEETLLNLRRSGVQYRIYHGKILSGTKGKSLSSVVHRLILEEGMSNREIKKYVDDNDFIYARGTLGGIISKIRFHHKIADKQTPDKHLIAKIKEYLAQGHNVPDTQRFIQAYMARTGIEFEKRYKKGLYGRISRMRDDVVNSTTKMAISVPENTRKTLLQKLESHNTTMSAVFESALKLRKGSETSEQLRTIKETLKRSHHMMKRGA